MIWGRAVGAKGRIVSQDLPHDVAARAQEALEHGQTSIGNEIGETHAVCSMK
jgi:hypothetical protein